MYRATLDGRTLGAGSLSLAVWHVADAATRLLADDPDGAAQDVALIHEAVTSGSVAEAVQRLGSWQADVTVSGRVVTVRVVGDTMRG